MEKRAGATRRICVDHFRDVKHMVDIATDSRNRPDMFPDSLRRATEERHTVEVDDKTRTNINKPSTAKANGNSAKQCELGMDGNKSVHRRRPRYAGCTINGIICKIISNLPKEAFKSDRSAHYKTVAVKCNRWKTGRQATSDTASRYANAWQHGGSRADDGRQSGYCCTCFSSSKCQ